MKRSIELFIDDMIIAIDHITEYTEDLSYENFSNNQLVIDAVLRNLEIIGEAANNIPKETQNNYPHIPWNRMIGLRNIVTHAYFGIDLSIIWTIIKVNLPETKSAIIEMRKSVKD